MSWCISEIPNIQEESNLQNLFFCLCFSASLATLMPVNSFCHSAPTQSLDEPVLMETASVFVFVNVVFAVRSNKQCSDLCRRMPQHRRSNSPGEDSAVHLHLKSEGHSFADDNILTGKEEGFERGVQ